MQQHFVSLMERWYVAFVGNQLFLDKINLENTFPDPLFACVIPEILLRKHILSTNTLYVMQPYKQLTENISKRGTQQAGGDFLS